jgi:IstB-like ATP binding protein/DDE superfamily endonuclease
MAETGTTTTEAQQWAEGLSSIGQRIGRHFARAEPRRRALAYLQGLLSPLERKNGWQLAEEAGDPTPDGVQHLLGRAQWDADAVRNDLCAYVVEHLGDKQGVLIVDEIGYLPIDRQGANLFFQLVSRRYERGSIIITSNQSLGAWGEVFGDPVIASAILDRLLHHSITVNIKGESFRLKEKLRAGLLKPKLDSPLPPLSPGPG